MVTSFTGQLLQYWLMLRRRFDNWLIFLYQRPLRMEAFPHNPPVFVEACAFCNQFIVIVLGVFCRCLRGFR